MPIGAENTLTGIIIDEIRRSGPITFARYMELALYHPEFGYYRTADRFGPRGDFYTAEQLQPVFGEVLARFVDHLTKQKKNVPAYSVLEVGAGRAELANALAKWNYRAFDWAAPSLPEKMQGLILANEFFDALPVHLLTKSHARWNELRVGYADGRLTFVEQEGLSQSILTEYAETYGKAMAEGDVLEVCLDLKPWCERLSKILVDGDLLVIDYGYHPRELVRFLRGSFISYKDHHSSEHVLQTPGERDITAHVNFEWLKKWAEWAGFRFHSSVSFAQWLLSIWTEDELQSRWMEADQRWKLQWKHLLFGLGEVFRVVRFEKAEAAPNGIAQECGQ